MSRIINRYHAGQPSEQIRVADDLAALSTAYQQALEDFRTLRATREGFDDDMLDAATALHQAWTTLKVAHARGIVHHVETYQPKRRTEAEGRAAIRRGLDKATAPRDEPDYKHDKAW